jgi:hypothetical protein
MSVASRTRPSARLGRRRVPLHLEDAPASGATRRWNLIAEQLAALGLLAPGTEIDARAFAGCSNTTKFDTSDSVPSMLHRHGLAPWRTGATITLVDLAAAYVELFEPDEYVEFDGPSPSPDLHGYGNSEEQHWSYLQHLRSADASAMEVICGFRPRKVHHLSRSEFDHKIAAYRVGSVRLRPHRAQAKPDVHLCWDQANTRCHLLGEVKTDHGDARRTDTALRQLLLPAYTAVASGAVRPRERVKTALVVFDGWGSGRFFRFEAASGRTGLRVAYAARFATPVVSAAGPTSAARGRP